MANSLCHGDLNMTGADNLWRHSRYFCIKMERLTIYYLWKKIDIKSHLYSSQTK